METIKHINANGKMSNLVGMIAFIWEEDKLKKRLYVLGKADDQHYIVQSINALSGSPNVCKIVELKDMLTWTFCPTQEIADEYYDDYCKHKINRYK